MEGKQTIKFEMLMEFYEFFIMLLKKAIFYKSLRPQTESEKAFPVLEGFESNYEREFATNVNV